MNAQLTLTPNNIKFSLKRICLYAFSRNKTLHHTWLFFSSFLTEGVTEAHGASYSFEYRRGYHPVINDEQVTRAVEEIARKTFGEAAVELTPPAMGSEDFSAFQREAPGCFLSLGARNEEKGITYPHHHPRFTIDEDALPIGVKVFVCATFGLLDAVPDEARARS